MGRKIVVQTVAIVPVDPQGDRVSASIARRYKLDRPNYEAELRSRIAEFNKTGVHMPWPRGTKIKYAHKKPCGEPECPQQANNVTGRPSRYRPWQTNGGHREAR